MATDGVPVASGEEPASEPSPEEGSEPGGDPVPASDPGSGDKPEPKANIKLEVMGGLTTFLTMSYIVAINPLILKESGLDFSAIVTATVLAAAVGSIAMGLIARLPYAVAPGMGLNAFFTYDLVKNEAYGINAYQALGLVFLSGVIFLVLSATPLRREVARAIPAHLREAIAGGIGIFLAFIGLQKTGLVVTDPATLVDLTPTLGAGHALFVVGLLVAVWLMLAKKPYAFLAAMGTATLLGLLLVDEVKIPESLAAAPDFSLFFAFDFTGALKIALIPPLITLFFTDLFDSLSTFLGVAKAADLVDENGEPLRLERALVVDAGATFVSGLVGTSPATAYVESTAGIEAGGRTGLTAIVVGLAFLPLIFLSPLIEMIPAFAIAPVLVIVGALMARAATQMGERPLEERVPAFLVLILIPLTYSITTGILVGFILHPLLFLLAGRAREVRKMMWGLFLLSIPLLAMETLTKAGG